MFELFLIWRASAKLVCNFKRQICPETRVQNVHILFKFSALARQIEKNYFNRKLVSNFKRQIYPETWVKNVNNIF